MAKKRTTTVTEEHLTDDMALEGWLLELGTDPEIQAVHVWKQNARGGWTRLPGADLAPPFEGPIAEVFERYGDGVYRFVGIGPRMKFRGGSRAVPVAGYGEGSGRAAAPGPGSTTATAGALDAMRETVDQMRLEVQMASLQRMLDRMNPPAAPGEPPLSREERAVLHQEALDRDLDRVAKLKALMGGDSRHGDPLEFMGKALDLVVSKVGGRGGSAVGNLKETLELLTLAKDILGGGGPGEDTWTGVLRDLIRNPEVLSKVREAIQAGQQPAGVPPGYRPVAPAPPPLRPWTQVHPFPTPAPPPPAAAPAPPAGPANSPGPVLPADHPWEVLRTRILPALLEGAARGDRAFTPYAELIDRHLPPAAGQPGALEEFVQYEFPVTLERLAQLEPRVREPAIAAWLQEFYTFVRDDYFLPEEGPHGGPGAPEGGTAAAGTGAGG